MEEQPQYTDFHMFLGITAGLAAGAIAGTIFATSFANSQSKKRQVVTTDDWQKYFFILTKTAQTVLKEVPGFIHDVKFQNKRKYPELEENR